jgi:hypothetical protein
VDEARAEAAAGLAMLRAWQALVADPVIRRSLEGAGNAPILLALAGRLGVLTP